MIKKNSLPGHIMPFMEIIEPWLGTNAKQIASKLYAFNCWINHIVAFAKKYHLWARNTPVTQKMFTAFDKQHEYSRYFQHIFITYLYVFLKCTITVVRKLTLVEIMLFNCKFLPQNSIPCFLKIVCIYNCNKTYTRINCWKIRKPGIIGYLIRLRHSS